MREFDAEHEGEFQMKVEEIKEHLQKIRAFIGKANQQQVRDQESILHDLGYQGFRQAKRVKMTKLEIRHSTYSIHFVKFYHLNNLFSEAEDSYT